MDFAHELCSPLLFPLFALISFVLIFLSLLCFDSSNRVEKSQTSLTHGSFQNNPETENKITFQVL